MGDPKRQRKKYVTPKQPWRVDRLGEELRLVGEYGLRNKRELWMAESILRKYRKIARSLFVFTGEGRARRERLLVEKLVKLGILSETATADDVLRLSVRDILERRLQTVVYRRGLASSMHNARQLIVHGKIVVGERKIRSPGYIVQRGEEKEIGCLLVTRQPA